MNEPALVTSCRSGLVDRSLSWRIAHTFDADALLKVKPLAINAIAVLKGIFTFAASISARVQ